MKKRRRALLLFITVVLVQCTACGRWLHTQQQQYARNRALIVALRHNDTTTALALVNAGADPNTRYSSTLAPSLIEQMKQLLHRMPPPANDSPTALMLACGDVWDPATNHHIMKVFPEENLPLLQEMLAHGANVRASAVNNNTALHYAVLQERVRTVELLLKRGADINAQNKWGTTPLMWAVSLPHAKTTRLLLSRGANPNTQDANGLTALHDAVAYSFAAQIVPELLAKGADPNLTDKRGQTALLYAREMNRPDLVRLLTRKTK